MSRLPHILLVCCAAIAGIACDESLRGDPQPSAQYAVAAPSAAVPADTRSLIQKMVDAPRTARVQGVRRVEAHWMVDGALQDLVYRERLSSDGQGDFAVDPLETVTPALRGIEESTFRLLQKQREGFMFAHRDFMVRDLDLFFARYRVRDLGVTTTVAGRDCAQLEVRLQQHPDGVYRLAVDLETGVVLRAREEALDGTLRSLVEFETFTVDPDFSATVFHTPLATRTELDDAGTPPPFEPARPKLLPAGYRLLSSSLLENTPDGKVWARLVYSDGLQELFFLHTQGAGTQERGTTPSDTVQVVEVGPWNVVQGAVFGGDVIVMGKAPVPELLDMIESAFE